MNLPSLKDAKKRTGMPVEYIYENKKITKVLDGKKYFIRTYGCQMNVHDSEEIKARLERLGLTETENMEDSDVVILNTCAIRENAHDKMYGFLGRCKHLKETKKDLIIGICGCMAQEESVCEEIIKKHPFVNLVFGTHNINELEELLLKNDHKLDINVYSIEGNVFENIPYTRDSKYKAWVNIQYGCDKFCTYCIVPYTRGKQRSRKSVDIINEVNNLVKEGYLEVTLLGQNVNAYGKDLENELSFARLLEEVSKTGIKRIFFVTSHPWDFTDELIDVIKKCENVCPYIHLPLQSGNDHILRLMGRRYTKDEYLTLVNKIKMAIPNVCLTTDIIVGFPGETEEEFQDTLDVVNEVKYDSAFTFIYSPRIGTPAALMKDDVTLEEKETRLSRLNELVNNYSLMNNQKYQDKIVDVLITDISEKDDSKVCGYTNTMKLVNITGGKNLIGSIAKVKITGCKSFSLDGEIID